MKFRYIVAGVLVVGLWHDVTPAMGYVRLAAHTCTFINVVNGECPAKVSALEADIEATGEAAANVAQSLNTMTAIITNQYKDPQ